MRGRRTPTALLATLLALTACTDLTAPEALERVEEYAGRKPTSREVGDPEWIAQALSDVRLALTGFEQVGELRLSVADRERAYQGVVFEVIYDRDGGAPAPDDRRDYAVAALWRGGGPDELLMVSRYERHGQIPDPRRFADSIAAGARPVVGALAGHIRRGGPGANAGGGRATIEWVGATGGCPFRAASEQMPPPHHLRCETGVFTTGLTLGLAEGGGEGALPRRYKVMGEGELPGVRFTVDCRRAPAACAMSPAPAPTGRER